MSEFDQQSPEYFEEHAIQTGRLISAAAYFDDALSEFLAEYLDLSELQENALLRPMSTRAKVDLLARLSKLHLEPDYEREIRPLFNSAREALDERNALVHGVPAQVDGKFALVSWAGKNRLAPEPDAWPVQRVCQLATRFIQLMDMFNEMARHFQEMKVDTGPAPRGD